MNGEAVQCIHPVHTPCRDLLKCCMYIITVFIAACADSCGAGYGIICMAWHGQGQS